MRKTILAAALAIAFPGATTYAETTQPNVCDAADKQIAYLEKEFGEKIVFRGLAANGPEIILLANREKGTWSLLVVRGEGQSCLGLAGKDAKVAWRGGTALTVPAGIVEF